MTTSLCPTVVLLLVLLTGSRINCSPVLESEYASTGNGLEVEFIDELLSSSLVDPIVAEGLEVFPHLNLLLQPPMREFLISAEVTTEEDFLPTDWIKHSKKPVAPTIFFQPSRFLEPPTSEFGGNPKKSSMDYRPVYSPISKTPSIDFRGHLFSELLPDGTPLSQRLPSSFAPLPPPSLSSGSPRSLKTQLPSTKLSEMKIKEQKKSAKTSVKDSEVTKDNKFELKKTQEGQVPPVIPEIEEPSLFLEPPTEEFEVRVPRMLLPPTREFNSGGSN